MKSFLIRMGINALALYVAIAIVPGIHTESKQWFSLLILGVIFGFLNATLRPFLTLLTCPLILLTLGFFVLLVNTLLFVLTGWIGSQISFGFTVDNFGAAFLGGVVTSVVSYFLSMLLKDELR